MRKAKWERAVRPYFDFLTDHGFRYSGSDASSDGWATDVGYRSDHHAVTIRFSIEFDRVEVSLARLVDGEMPPPMIFYSESEPFDATLLDNVVIARAPERVAEIEAATGLKSGAVDQQLAMWSSILRELAPDFLVGASEVFGEARAIVRERVAAEPQQVVIWLPGSASADEASARVDETRKTVPPEVEVVSRRYRAS